MTNLEKMKEKLIKQIKALDASEFEKLIDEDCLNQPRSAYPVYSVSLGGVSGILFWILLFPEHKIPYSLQKHVNNL